MNVLVLADTHVPDHARALPSSLAPHLRWAELILHAGDATSAPVLAELEAHAPVHAVLGNCDGWDVHALGLPEQLQLEVGGLTVAMLHDAGPREGREARLKRRFPDAQVIVFAHSHQPVGDRDGGVLFLNPGSPTWKRRAPQPTVARCTVAGGRFQAVLTPL